MSSQSSPRTPKSKRQREPTTPSSTTSSRRSGRLGSANDATSPLQRLESSPDAPRRVRETPSTPGSEMGSEASSALYTERDAMPPPTSPGSRTTMSRTGATSQAGGRKQTARPDINTVTGHHQMMNIERPSDMDLESGPESQGPRVVIWGTRVCVDDVKRSFAKFLEEYREEDPEVDEAMLAQGEVNSDQPFYLQQLQDIMVTRDNHLNINLDHVRKFKNSLYKLILCYPADVIPYLDIVANETFLDQVLDRVEDDEDRQIEVRPYNAAKTRNMRDLNPEDIDQLITITGMVIRTSHVIPEMRTGFFECTVCKQTTEREVDRGRIEEPILCRNCNNNHTFQLVHNRCRFMDKQIVKLQESPDDMPAGQTPHTVTLYAHGNLVDSIQPGDRVTVTGIYRAFPLRVNPKMRTVKSIYKTHVDVLHFRKFHSDRLIQRDGGVGDEGVFFPESRINDIQTLAQAPDVYDRLAHALAPSIYEHVDIKKGILCLLFGGTKKNFTTNGRGRFRSELNILLCGDPGTSKSQMLQYVHNIVPRGQYTSGKGSSAVGLTAYVTRDPETKHFVLQTGALVLSDNGVCCIDEFDKMNESTRAILHEVMEQQTLSIAKAGIICQLNARASVLAAANPVDSCWNKDKTIIENLQLPHTLLSRFDLIFLLVDPQDEYFDRRLATHLVSLYYRSEEAEMAESLDMHLIRDYIAYAKAYVHPKLSEAASQVLIEKYLSMRKIGKGRGVVSAYPRQLESLIRLAEAHAKIHLRDEVTEDDVLEAHRLHREALKQAATDPETGRVDVNILSAGMSDTTRKHIVELSSVLKNHLATKPFGHQFPLKKVLLELRENSDVMISKEIFDETVADLIKNEHVIRVGDKIRLLRSA